MYINFHILTPAHIDYIIFRIGPTCFHGMPMICFQHLLLAREFFLSYSHQIVSSAKRGLLKTLPIILIVLPISSRVSMKRLNRSWDRTHHWRIHAVVCNVIVVPISLSLSFGELNTLARPSLVLPLSIRNSCSYWYLPCSFCQQRSNACFELYKVEER